jgi:hypothetical protein
MPRALRAHLLDHWIPTVLAAGPPPATPPTVSGRAGSTTQPQ